MLSLPRKRSSSDQVLSTMRQAREQDARWQEGKTWSLVYYPGEEAARLLKEAYTLFFSENGLNPVAFPSLKKFETEIISMTANLLGGNEDTVGNLTSGGTESILMAVKTAREWGRKKNPDNRFPEMILPASAHPAFEKGAHYFSVKPVRIPVTSDFQADISAVRKAISANTVLLVGSAPSYPHGVIDPIADLGQIALEKDILLHVDACVGGFMLPFVRELGYPVPDFDLRIPGVTSLSVDLHKYGYAAKGVSAVLYKNKALRRNQFFVYADWPGGIYASPTMTGTRPGGPIAAAWAIMNYLGQEGYLAMAETVMKTTVQLRQGVEAIPELKILGDPVMSVLAIGSDTVNLYEVGDHLTLGGWHLDRQQFPPSLHLTVTPAHARSADLFLQDLQRAVAKSKRFSLSKMTHSLQVGLTRLAAKTLPPRLMSGLASGASNLVASEVPKRSAALYGMMTALPNRGDVNELVLDVLDGLTRLKEEPKGDGLVKSQKPPPDGFETI